MRGMRFSLSSLLICIAVLGVVCAICVCVPVDDVIILNFEPGGNIPHTPGMKLGEHVILSNRDIGGDRWQLIAEQKRQPNGVELAYRLAWSWPLGIAALLIVQWIAKRIKLASQRE